MKTIYRRCMKNLLHSSVFIALILIILPLYSNAGMVYRNGTVSGSIAGATVSEVLEQIATSSGKNITIEGNYIPLDTISVNFNNQKLDKAIRNSLYSAGLKNFNIVYDAQTPALSSAVRIILTPVFTPINEKTVNGYLNKKLGSRALLKWEPDAIALFEGAMKAVPDNIKVWVLRTLMSHVEADSEKVRSPKITKEMVAEILRRHTPQSDMPYLEQQINP